MQHRAAVVGRVPAGCVTAELWVALLKIMPGVDQRFWARVLQVRDVLAFSFDFDAFERALSSEEYATPAPWLPAFVVPGARVSVVARDGIGGVYAHCEWGRREPGQSEWGRFEQNQNGCCLHIDTRGHAVCLGEDVERALALVVAIPYWPELLAECPSGELRALRALAPRLEQEACDDLYELPAARQELVRFLELPRIADPILRLHELAVERAPPVSVWSPHGWRYQSPIRSVEARILQP